jgi:hypothetical protein
MSGQWKFIAPQEMTIQQYPCGAIAGEHVRLRQNLVCNDDQGRPTGCILRADEHWVVLTGHPGEPEVIWLRNPFGERHTWDDAKFWDSFERVPQD